MADVNYLGGAESPYGGWRPQGALGGFKYSDQVDQYNIRHELQNQLLRLSQERGRAELGDYKRGQESRDRSYDRIAREEGYKYDLLPLEQVDKKDTLSNKIQLQKQEHALKMKKAIAAIPEFERQQYIDSMLRAGQLGKVLQGPDGTIDDAGEGFDDKLQAYLNLMPKDDSLGQRWGGYWQEYQNTRANPLPAGVRPGDAELEKDENGNPTVITPSVDVSNTSKTKLLNELRMILAMDPEAMKQMYARRTQDVTEGGQTSRNDADNATALEVARINARSHAATSKRELDRQRFLAHQAQSKYIAIQRQAASLGVPANSPEMRQWAEANGMMISPDEEAAYMQEESRSAAAKARAQGMSKAEAAQAQLQGLGVQTDPYDFDIPSSLPPLQPGVGGALGSGTGGQTAAPESEMIKYKGQDAKVLQRNKDGSIMIEVNGKRVTLRPKK